MTQDSNGKSDKTLQGWVPEFAAEADVRAALDQAFDYRGDVTLTLTDGREIEGYIFDRRTGTGLDDSFVRMMPKDADERVNIAYSQIARLVFSGRDTAAGKSWETWVKKYVEAKVKGRKAAIEAEPLE